MNLDIEIDGDTFDRRIVVRNICWTFVRAGRWPAEFFYYAGGVPAIMEEIRDVLHLVPSQLPERHWEKIWIN